MVEFSNKWHIQNDTFGTRLDCVGYDRDSLILSTDNFEIETFVKSTHTLTSEFGSRWTIDASQVKVSKVDDQILLHANGGDSKKIFEDIGHHYRKHQHIDICLKKDVEARSVTGFEKVSFVPRAIPTISSSDINCTQVYLGREFKAPLFITGMTGGIESGHKINRRLARAAVKHGLAMGVGSQRMALENPEWESVFKLKDEFSELFLMGNLGFAQLTDDDAVEKALKAYKMIEADALCIHVNVMQELVQSEGDKDFVGFLDQLEKIVNTLPCPVVIKEVGCGFDLESVKAVKDRGVAAVDVSGSGGTSWPYIEQLRVTSGSDFLSDGDVFRNWGIPTAYCLKAVSSAYPDLEVTATGGIRSGLDVAKAIALGARMVGVGLPFFKAAHESADALDDVVAAFIRQLKIVMQATSSRTLSDLKKRCIFGSPYEEALVKNEFYD